MHFKNVEQKFSGSLLNLCHKWYFVILAPMLNYDQVFPNF